MNGRLVVAIISNLAEEVALVAVVLWGLPLVGINISLGGLVALMTVWIAISALLYLKGSQALSRKAVIGLTDMIDSKGKVLSPLLPRGTVRIKGETWDAISADRKIGIGEEVVVVGQNRLKLIVRKVDRQGS